MVPDTVQINTYVRIVFKMKEGGQEIAGLVKLLSRFPGLDNFMVCTFSNPQPPMSVSTAGPLWGPLPAIGSQGGEKMQTPARVFRVRPGWVGFYPFFFFPASYIVSPSLEMTLLTAFFLGSLHATEYAEVVWQLP